MTRTDFEKLFRTYYNELCSYAFHFTKDLDDAEEIVQNIFVKFWEKKDTINIKTSKKSYLYSSVKNRCLNLKKHIEVREEYKEFNKREIELEENLPENDEDENKTEKIQKIRKVIDAMPKKRKKVFLLSRYDNLKYKEIAKKLNISIKTVENHMGQALKYLREELRE